MNYRIIVEPKKSIFLDQGPMRAATELKLVEAIVDRIKALSDISGVWIEEEEDPYAMTIPIPKPLEKAPS